MARGTSPIPPALLKLFIAPTIDIGARTSDEKTGRSNTA